MMVYVLFGGMVATTWVQIIKAVPAARRALTFMAVHGARAGSASAPRPLFAEAVGSRARQEGAAIMAPGQAA